MTLHQVNGDGAGPMACSVDPTAQGNNFQDMTISTNVPGNNGKSGAANQDFPLVAQMPTGVACTGTVAGQNNLCMIKCQNPAGPFGGVVAVQSGGAGGKGGNSAGGNAASGVSSAVAPTATDAGGNANNGGQNASNAAGNSTTAAGGNVGGTTGKKGRQGKGRKQHQQKKRIMYLD